MSAVERTNAWVPCVLIAVHLAALLIAGVLGARWLSPEVVQVLADYPRALALALRFFDAKAQAQSNQFLAAAPGYLLAQGSFQVWAAASFGLAALATWAMQVVISGLQPMSRYLMGVVTAVLVQLVTWLVFNEVGLGLAGWLSGYVMAQFTGWWVAVGYLRTSDRQTDARTVRADLAFARPFKPEKYFNLRKGMFMGLQSDGRPVYIGLRDARKHLQLLGETRNGKTVAATVLLAQCARLQETVIVMDPKADKHAPGVLKAAAEAAKVPFVYIDLRPDQPPQLDLFAGAASFEIEELLISAFDLASKGTDADVYRVEDRAAARKLARSEATTVTEMVAIGAADETVTDARKFWEDLRELADHPVIQTQDGWRLHEWVGKPCVIYIAGSTRHDNTVRLQKIVLLRLLQLIDTYGAGKDANWTALFIDEFKYLLSQGALRALGTIGDRNCHLLIAHQSLGDLRDVAGLDPQAVYGAAVVNTGLKLFYKTNDPETATWGAKLSGQIPTYTETVAKSPSASPGAYQERGRPLIDENMLLSLPPLTGMLYGAGVAKLLCVHYLDSATQPPRVRAAEPEVPFTTAEAPI